MYDLSNRAEWKGRDTVVTQMAKKAPLWAATAGYMVFMARAKLFAPMDALAPAACAAGVFSGLNPLFLLVGCAIGDWRTLGACGLSILVWALSQWLCARRRAPSGIQEFACAMAAGVGALCGGLIVWDGTFLGGLRAVLGAAVSSLLSPTLMSALGIRRGREMLLPDEQLSLAVHATVALFAICSLLGGPAALTLAAFSTLLASSVSAGHGVIAGLLSGFALSMAGEGPALGAAMGLSALLAGCVRPAGRWAAALAFVGGGYICTILGAGLEEGALPLVSLAIACGVYMLLPEKLETAFSRLFSPQAGQISAERLSLHLRARAEGRLRRLSGALCEMRDGYAVQANAPERQALVERMRESLCAGCEGYAACWGGGGRGAGILLIKAAEDAAAGRSIPPFSQLPPDESHACRRASLLDRRVTPIAAAFSQKRQSELTCMRWRSLVSQQMGAAADMLQEAADQLARPARPNEALSRVAEAALERAGMRGCRVQAVEDGQLELYAMRRDGAWSAQAARTAAHILSEELGEEYMPELIKNGAAPLEMRFVRAPAFTVHAAAASRAAKEGEACGDSHMACPLPDNRYLLALSDGMGQGETAAQESRETLRLTRAFCLANVGKQAAVPAINGLLMLRDEEMFSTLDLCIIDRMSGEASFEKLGGCRSVVVSGRKTVSIPGGQLPLGILEEVNPQSSRVRLTHGDWVVILSDGAADVLEDADILRLAHGIKNAPPLQLAAALLDLAVERGARDDATALAARIEARKAK